MVEFTSTLTRQLLDLAPDATVIVDEGGEIIYANAQTESVLGYLPDEIIGMQVEMLLPERFRTRHPRYRHDYFNNPRPRSMGEGLDLWALRKDGSEIPVEISLSPVESGKGMLVCSSIRDVTERYRIQEQFKAAKQEADLANRAKSIFLAAASHDLRQPLQTLNMLNAILKRLVQSPKALRVIEDQGEALGSISDMLNSLLDISKLDAGVIIPDMQDHSVRQIFQGLRKQFAGLAETKGIDFVVDECRETIHSDPGLLMQILYNLVSNAIRYTSEGQVRIRCLHDKSFVGIQVLDTGIGIPHDQIEVVFKEFYQIHHGPKYKEGFGLGLAVVRRLTDLLGHRLELESQPGRGSCFSVYVPVGTTSEPDVRPSPVYRTEPTKSKVVLLVDDSLPVLDATRTLLEIEGFTTLTAASREEAMKRIDNGKVKLDIIVCDFHIPGTDNGLELIQDLRSVIGMEIPAVLATGDTSTSVKSLIRTVNDCTLLNKPMRIDVLLETINSFTDKQPAAPGLKN